MPITLPYEFDTTREGTWVVKIMLGLEFIVAVGIVYSLGVSRSWPAVLQLSLTGAVLLFFILRLVKNLTGSIGTITANEIVVKRRNVYGLEFSGPAGVFSLHQFTAVRGGDFRLSFSRCSKRSTRTDLLGRQERHP